MLDEDGRVHEFAELLRRARLSAGLTQEQLAERAGVSVRGISDLERGSRRSPRRDTVKLLAGALDLSAEQRQKWEQARHRQTKNRATHHPSGTPVAPLFGRDAEQNSLRAGLQSALNFRRQLILLAGEPGIGKTRLAEDLAVHAETCGFISCWGRCYDGGGAPAYWPWIQVMRAALQRVEPESLRSLIDLRTIELFHLLPELRTRLISRSHAVPDADSSRFRLMDSVTVFLQRVAASRPVLIVLDDLQWADHSSLLLLEYLAKELPAGQLMVVGLYRDTEIEPGSALASAVLAVGRQSGSRHLSLTGIDANDVEAMVSQIAVEDLPAEMVTHVATRAAGNPFFVSEIVRHIESASTTGRDTYVPDGVREVIRQRLQRLNVESQKVLQAAAVVGREFNFRLLEHTLGLTATDVLDSIDEAASARLVSKPTGLLRSARFEHDLIRETIFDDLRSSQRISLHYQIALALERQQIDGNAAGVGNLAHHYSMAIPVAGHEPAVSYLCKAGNEALAQIGYDNAAEFFARAVTLLDQQGELESEDGAETLLSLGVAQMRAGNIPGARETFQRVTGIARKKVLPEHFARAAIGFSGGVVLVGRDDAEACELLAEACCILGPQDSSLKAQCLARLALKLVSDTDQAEADLRARINVEAIDVAQRVNDLEAEAIALHAHHREIWTREPSDPETGIAAAKKAVQVAQASGNTELIFTTLCWRMFEPLELGDLGAVNGLLEECERIALSLKQPFYNYMVLSLRAMHFLVTGRLQEAQQNIDRALEMADEVGIPGGYSIFWWWLLTFQLQRELDHVGELESLVVGMFDENLNTRHGMAIVKAQIALVRAVRYAEGDLPNSDLDVSSLHAEIETMITTVTGISDLSPRSHIYYALVHLAEAAHLTHDLDAADRLYELLDPMSMYVATVGGSFMTVGSIAHYCGLLATTLSRWDAAERHFEDALDTNERLGFRLYATRTRHAWADLLLRRQRPGDSKRASDLLHVVEETAAEIGMAVVSKQVDTLKRQHFCA
jgi:transcriptional regulator with XRE-family HTH domain/tetratricopeptide (TPR) repeat protein